MRKVVGIDRKIKRAWVDAFLDRLTQTTDQVELRTFLDKRLKDELPGKESRAKAAGIILRIWSGIPPERVSLRDRAVAMLPRISGQERIWLHWGMAALAYPFFRDAVEVVGRLLALQDDFTTAQVQGRMLTNWGDRATSKEAAQKLITTLVDWDVLRSTKTKGHFLPARKMTASIMELQLWLLEALLAASAADEIEVQQLLRLPETFPFTVKVGVADIRRHEGFNIHRQGLNMDMVAIRRVKIEPLKKASKRKATPKKVAANQFNLFDQESNEARDRESGTLNRVAAPFAASIAECAELFDDGRFHAASVLAQAIIEAAVFLIWEVNVRRRKNQSADFEKALDALRANLLISDTCKARIETIRRDRFTPLVRPSTESTDHVLEESARSGLELANSLSASFFGYCQQDGVIIPDHPEYWSSCEARYSQ